MDNKILVIGGIAVVGLLLLNKKKAASSGGTSTPSITKNPNGSSITKVGDVILSHDKSGNITGITDSAGHPIDSPTMTDQQKADLIAAQNAKNADIVKNNWSDPSQWTDIPFVNGIPKDLYDTYLANKDLYAQKGKPPPIWYDNTVPGVVTAIPYNDPSKAVTYADPDGTLKFTNANGTPVPNDPNAVVISNTPTIAATPVAPDQTYWQPAPVAVPIQSSPVTSTYTQSQYDADMALLAKNAPSLLTPEELAKYGGGVTPTPPALVIAPVFTQNNGLTQVVYGLGTDSPYQVDETGIHYI